MGFGVPVVATTIAVEGMGLKHKVDVMVADTAEAFADALLELYQSEILWNRLSENSVQKTKELYSVDAARKQLDRILARARFPSTRGNLSSNHG